MNKIHLTLPDRDKLSKNYFRSYYGTSALVTPLGNINLIHQPPEIVIRERIAETLIEQSHPNCDCHICRDYKDKPMDIVYVGPDFDWPGPQYQ